MARWQLAVAPEVRAEAGVVSLVHPVTDIAVPVPPAFVDVLPYAQRPFTPRELVERSGAALSTAGLSQTLAELVAAGFLVPATSITERIARGAMNPWRWLGTPLVALPLLGACALGAALQLQSIAFFAGAALHSLRGTVVVPFLVAVILLPAARSLFRAQVLQSTARPLGVSARLHGVIPVWEVEHAPATTRSGRLLAHLSGFLFDGIVINVCALSMRAKPFELGYAGLELPVAFLAVAASLSVIAANPFAKYDAYFALEDLLDVADLRGHARARAFQLLSRRRLDASTLLYGAYFAATILYSLFISFGLLAIAYGLAARLFPADPPYRLALASGLVGVVLWRAVRTIHRPVVRAINARRRARKDTVDKDPLDIALPAPTRTLTPSLHASEGFPYGLSLRESVDDRTHDFSAFGPAIEVMILREDALRDVRRLDVDSPAMRALSQRMFGAPPRALSTSARQALAVAHAAQATLPLERYEPVPDVSLVDGTFKHGALDVAARLRSASELDVYRALFQPLRSRHVVERDRVALAFRDKATDRFSHFVLIDNNDAPGLALRIAGLSRSVERARPAARVAGAEELLAELKERTSRAHVVLAAKLRRTTPELLEAAGAIPVFSPLEPASLSPQARAWGLEAGLFFEETRDGATQLACQVRCPTLVIPTGREGAPTGLKLRVLLTDAFEPATRVAAPIARYEFVSPHRNFLGAVVHDAGELPIWISKDGDGDGAFVFDGELKAIACRHVLQLRAVSAGGFNHPFQSSLAAHLAKEREVTFVLDDEAPVYRRGRTDQLHDPIVRTLQLAWRTQQIAPQIDLALMKGLVNGDKKKLDLDEVAGLHASARDAAIREFRAHTAATVDARALLASPQVGPYVQALCEFSDRFYSTLHEARSARARGSTSEVRIVVGALTELAEKRKQLLARAADVGDIVRRALKGKA